MSNEEQAVSSDDLVAVPRGLLGAALHAIRMQVEAPGTFAELRRYTTGDLARSSIVPAVSEAEPKCHKCGTPMVRNPHPDAGKMHRMLEVGCPLECLPCTVLSRHQWSSRAYAAEKALRDSAANSRIAGDGEAGNWKRFLFPGETTAEQICERMDKAVSRLTVQLMQLKRDGEAGAVPVYQRLVQAKPEIWADISKEQFDTVKAITRTLYAAPPEKQTSHSEGDAGGKNCPRCGKPAGLLFSFTDHGDELGTKHCGCLHGAAPTVPHSLTVAQGDAERYRQFDQALTERDHAEDMADKMAEAIGKHFGVDVGEHSNLHCPWKEALGVIAERAQGDELSGNSGELARQQGGSDAERQKALGEAVERACRELPADYEIQITLENGYGGAKLYQFDGGISTDLDDDDERDLAREISEGIATAIAQRAAAQGANDAS